MAQYLTPMLEKAGEGCGLQWLGAMEVHLLWGRPALVVAGRLCVEEMK